MMAEEYPDDTRLDVLPLKRAIVTALERAGFRTAGDVRIAPATDLIVVRGLGRAFLQQIHDVIGHDELAKRWKLETHRRKE